MPDRRPHLELALQHRVGPLSLDLAFTLTEPWSVLFAPSGAGKSTVLRILAGLARPTTGRIVVHSPEPTPTTLLDTQRGINVPPHRRNIRLVAQNAALFPHRTVLANVTFGMSGPGQPERSHDLLTLCRAHALADKMPASLSSGERQRVSLARALAVTPTRLLLLDEPFSGLDLALRDELLGNLRPWLAARQIPVLQVTHDIGEVFSLGAHVLRMHDGRITAQGSPAEVLHHERNWLAAHLAAPGSSG